MSAKIRLIYACIQEENHVTKKIKQNDTKNRNERQTKKKNRLTDKETEYRLRACEPFIRSTALAVDQVDSRLTYLHSFSVCTASRSLHIVLRLYMLLRNYRPTSSLTTSWASCRHNMQALKLHRTRPFIN